MTPHMLNIDQTHSCQKSAFAMNDYQRPGPASMASRQITWQPHLIERDDGMCAFAPEDLDEAKHLRVLIIEDNPDLLYLIKDIVSLLGYEAETAMNATLGVNLARSFKPSVILCDIGLPDMAGYEVARILRNDRVLKDICMISMSGYGQWEHIEKSRDAGFDRHLVKPVDLYTLNQLLSEGTRHAVMANES